MEPVTKVVTNATFIRGTFGFTNENAKEIMKKYFIKNLHLLFPTTDGKLIEEHHGLATTNNSTISIAHMIAPPGWSRPFQTPEFDEYNLHYKKAKSNL